MKKFIEFMRWKDIRGNWDFSEIVTDIVVIGLTISALIATILVSMS